MNVQYDFFDKDEDDRVYRGYQEICFRWNRCRTFREQEGMKGELFRKCEEVENYRKMLVKELK